MEAILASFYLLHGAVFGILCLVLSLYVRTVSYLM